MLRELIHPAPGDHHRASSTNSCCSGSTRPKNGPKTAQSERSAIAIAAISATAQMPSRPELERICRAAVADFPDVSPDRLRRFLEAADDAEWATEPAARQIARRMHEGLIVWMPGDE